MFFYRNCFSLDNSLEVGQFDPFHPCSATMAKAHVI